MEIFWTRKAQDDLERIYQFALQWAYFCPVTHREKSEKCFLMNMKCTMKYGALRSIFSTSGIAGKIASAPHLFYSQPGTAPPLKIVSAAFATSGD